MSKIFFSNFPTISYWFADKVPTKIRHIVPRAKMFDLVQNNSGNYMPYRITDGETLETVSLKVYGDARWYWVIALYNNILDPYEDWPRDAEQFEYYLDKKYGNTENNIHHYVDDLGNECQLAFETSTTVTSVTIREYEEQLNTEKRLIKIPLQQYLPSFLKMLETAMVDA